MVVIVFDLIVAATQVSEDTLKLPMGLTRPNDCNSIGREKCQTIKWIINWSDPLGSVN